MLRLETEQYEREKAEREKAEREAIEQSRLGRLEQDRILQEERQRIEKARIEQQRAQIERQQKQEREIAERKQNSTSPKPVQVASVPQIPAKPEQQESPPQEKKLYDFGICFMSTVPKEQVNVLEVLFSSALVFFFFFLRVLNRILYSLLVLINVIFKSKIFLKTLNYPDI